VYYELLTKAVNWRNCKYVYNNMPVFAVFAKYKDWKRKQKFLKIHVTWALHCKMLHDNRVGSRMDSLNMVIKRINKIISIQQFIN